MRIAKSTLAAILLLLSCKRAGAQDAFDRAQHAAGRGDVREAAKLFAEAARTETNRERREQAVVHLANIEWRIFRDFGAARKSLQPLESADGLIELSRIALDQHDYAAAVAEARHAIAAAKKKKEKWHATLQLGLAIVFDPHASEAALRGVVDSMRELIATDGPYIGSARLLTRAALRAHDGAAALEGINAYYHVSAFSGPPNAIAAGHAALAAALPKWNGSPDIADALAAIRFFDEAAIVAPRGEIADYAAALRRIEAATNEYYRQIALGNEKPDNLRAALQREKKSQALVPRFGTYVNIGKTGSHIDLHMGHIVTDTTLRVEQYGHTASVRFIALDSMVSNGYSQWLYDDESGDGGWATATEIYQVRQRYADGPLHNWALVFDDEVRAEDVRKTNEETERDRTRAKENPIQYFPGLAQRLQRQYLERVAAETKSRDAFLARVEREQFLSSIVLHEGRHAIDRASGQKYQGWEMEYRAKLSEIALAPAPREALAGIVDNDIGGEGTHAKANAHLAEGLAAWMEAHRGEIAGYDPTLPPFPQVDQLTDEQIVAAVRALDPMAR